MGLAFAYATLCGGVVVFQLCLIAGAPWGQITQGGRVLGALPPLGRFVAAVSVPIVVGKALAVLSVAGIWPGWPLWTIWPALGVQLVVTVLNVITPSQPERQLWAPITSVMLVLAGGTALLA